MCWEKDKTSNTRYDHHGSLEYTRSRWHSVIFLSSRTARGHSPSCHAWMVRMDGECAHQPLWRGSVFTPSRRGARPRLASPKKWAAKGFIVALVPRWTAKQVCATMRSQSCMPQSVGGMQMRWSAVRHRHSIRVSFFGLVAVVWIRRISAGVGQSKSTEQEEKRGGMRQ